MSDAFLLGIGGVVALVALALLSHYAERLNDRIARGRSPVRREERRLRAEDAATGRPEGGLPSGPDSDLDRKRWDGSGIAGL